MRVGVIHLNSNQSIVLTNTTNYPPPYPRSPPTMFINILNMCRTWLCVVLNTHIWICTWKQYINSQSLSLSLSLTHTLSLSLSQTQTQTHTLTLSLKIWRETWKHIILNKHKLTRRYKQTNIYPISFMLYLYKNILLNL